MIQALDKESRKNWENEVDIGILPNYILSYASKRLIIRRMNEIKWPNIFSSQNTLTMGKFSQSMLGFSWGIYLIGLWNVGCVSFLSMLF